jgi:propanol-preferring alcohol dehydrogenase
MRALRLLQAGNPVALAEIPDPSPGPREVLVRVVAAGICHSDVHYRAGRPAPPALPVTLGHEIAGEVVAAGTEVPPDRIGRRVALHYVLACGTCRSCRRDMEQFCDEYGMLGTTADGGWSDLITVPDRNAVPVPDAIPLEHAAVMMCSSATSLHALRRGRLARHETVAVFGAGGLGLSAVQLALAIGADRVFAVDLSQERLAIAEDLGAVPVPADSGAVRVLQDGGGVDVALDLVGSEAVLGDALASLRPGGRAVAVGITARSLDLDPYRQIIGPEAELIGSNDHTLGEVEELLVIAEMGALRLDAVVTAAVPLDARAVNAAMDELEGYGSGVRTVITP